MSCSVVDAQARASPLVSKVLVTVSKPFRRIVAWKLTPRLVFRFIILANFSAPFLLHYCRKE